MLILTNADRTKRLNELQKPEIDSLMKKAHKRRGSSAQYILYSKYGIEGDYKYDGYDTGNFPRGEN